MNDDKVTCDVCRIGRCQLTKAPYLYWVDDQVMVMPNSPALACDICGHVHFEPSFLVLIEGLLQELESSMEMRRAAQTRIETASPVGLHSSRSTG